MIRWPTALAFGLVVVLGPVSASGQDAAPGAAEEVVAIMRANGTFEAKLGPLETYTQTADSTIGRMSIDKTFAGNLAGSSQGEMLSGGSPATGSAGYPAIERVTGTLGGRGGSFLLQHSGTMTPAAQELTITVVPGSGTGERAGIAGTMSIEIEDGQHLYHFDYTLPNDS